MRGGYARFGGYVIASGGRHHHRNRGAKQIAAGAPCYCAPLSQTILSVDTFRSTIANEALTMGADLINDISGGEFDPQMPALIGSQNVPYVLMHMHRNPEQMQESPLGEEAFDVVRQFFKRQTALLRHMVQIV